MILQPAQTAFQQQAKASIHTHNRNTSVVYKLSKAPVVATESPLANIATPLNKHVEESSSSSSIKPNNDDEDMELDPQYSSMLNSYLERTPANAFEAPSSSNSAYNTTKQNTSSSSASYPLKNNTTSSSQNVSDLPDGEAEDYVYDIYFRYQIDNSSDAQGPFASVKGLGSSQSMIPGPPQATGNGIIGLM